MVPVVGLEPTRVAPTDFESVTSAIPSHRRMDSLFSISNFDDFVKSAVELTQLVQISVAVLFAGMLDAFIATELALAIEPGGDFTAGFQRKEYAKAHERDDQRHA